MSDERQQWRVNLNPNDRVPVDSGGPSGHISQVLYTIISVFTGFVLIDFKSLFPVSVFICAF